jgi:hypothetical protein
LSQPPPQDHDLPPVPDLPLEVQDALEAAHEELADRLRKLRVLAVVCFDHVHCYDDLQPSRSDGWEARSAAYDQLVKDEGLWSDAPRNPYREERNQFDGPYEMFDTPPSVFRNYFNFYVDRLIAKLVLRIFQQLLAIGQRYFGRAGIKWAASETLKLIQSIREEVISWVRLACDPNPVDPLQAQAFLTMYPAGPAPYDRHRIWERMDPASSSEMLEGIANESMEKLKDCIAAAARKEALERAEVRDQKLVKSPAPEVPSGETQAEGSSGKVQAQDEEPPKPVQPEISGGKVEGKRKYTARKARKANPKKETLVKQKIDKGEDIRKSEAVTYWRRDRATINNWLEKDKITLPEKCPIPNRVARRWLTEHPQASVPDG